MDQTRSVLIVDHSEETREVLQTALGLRGLRTYSAGRPGRALELARRHHPDLIVLDLEMDDSESNGLLQPLAEQSRDEHVPLVLLGTVRQTGEHTEASGEFVAKPYHYGPLIRKIEELLDASSPHVRRCV